MKTRIKLAPGLLAALVIFAASSPAFAATLLKIKANAFSGGSNTWETGSVGPIFDSSITNQTWGSAYAEGSVDYGIIKLYGEAHSISNALQGSAEAEWNDVLTFNAPGMAGQNGFATLHYQIDGTFDAGSPSNSHNDSVNLSLSVSSLDTFDSTSSSDGASFQYYGDGELHGTNFLNAARTLEVSFTYGEPLELRFWLKISATAAYQNGSYAMADLSHTATWGGITGIEDSFHNVVTNFTLHSESETNYLSAIPEPSVTTLFIGAGTFVFAFARRRFRKE